MRISHEAQVEMERLLDGRPESAGVRFFLRGWGWSGPRIGQTVVDGPAEGDTVVAPRIYMDTFCARFAESGEIDWNPGREKLWIRHRLLSAL